MKIMSPRVHGYIDYALVVLLVLAPAIFGFTAGVATLCYVLAAVQLVMSLLTNYPLGAAKLIPFPIHGGIELAAGIGMLASPWLFGFEELTVARNFFIILGVAVGMVWLVTNYTSVPARTDVYDRYSR